MNRGSRARSRAAAGSINYAIIITYINRTKRYLKSYILPDYKAYSTTKLFNEAYKSDFNTMFYQSKIISRIDKNIQRIEIVADIRVQDHDFNK